MYEQAKQRRTTLPKEGREEQARARDREQKKLERLVKEAAAEKLARSFGKKKGAS